jgi:RNA polymerase sigma factor (sigma-70 family)
MTTSDPQTPARTAAHDERRERLSELCRGALAGHREDLDQIVVELTPLLWRVARAHRLDPATCEEVVQTAWLTLLSHLDQIRNSEALVGWLVTVTRREALRVLASQTRTSSTENDQLALVPNGSQPVDEMVVAGERRNILWRVIHELPSRCIQLLQVIAFSDRPDYEAIANALGMPKGSIGPTRGRCLAKLRALLSAQPDWSWS